MEKSSFPGTVERAFRPTGMTWTTRRRNIAMIGGLAVLLAACASEAGSTPQEITVNTSEEATSGISVSGMGEVTGTPDTVEVGLGVSVLGETVDQAASTAAEKAQAVIDALTSNGVAEEDITTTDYSIYPEYDYSGNEERLVGYRDQHGQGQDQRPRQHRGNPGRGDRRWWRRRRSQRALFQHRGQRRLVAAAREAAERRIDQGQPAAELFHRVSGRQPRSPRPEHAPDPNPYAAEAAEDRAMETPIEPGTSAVTITLQVEFALAG